MSIVFSKNLQKTIKFQKCSQELILVEILGKTFFFIKIIIIFIRFSGVFSNNIQIPVKFLQTFTAWVHFNHVRKIFSFWKHLREQLFSLVIFTWFSLFRHQKWGFSAWARSFKMRVPKCVIFCIVKILSVKLLKNVENHGKNLIFSCLKLLRIIVLRIVRFVAPYMNFSISVVFLAINPLIDR